MRETLKTTNRMMLNVIIWNDRGTKNVEFKRNDISMICMHNPTMLFLLETRMGDYRQFIDKLGFTNQI